MRKILPLSLAVLLSMQSCSILSELTALTKCEFSFHSAENPVVSGINMSRVSSFSDLSLLDGQRVLSNIMQRRLPFSVTANVAVRNPGPATAAVNYIEWIAFIDDIQVSTGRVDNRVEIPGGGATSIVPIRIETDLYQYLKGDNPRTMLNFALNLVDAGGQPTRLSMKIKPSVMIGGTLVPYPDYFTIEKTFSSGN